MKADQEKVRALLRDTVALLCRNGLAYDTELKIEGVIGITVNKNDVFIVHINETIENSQALACAKVIPPAILPDSYSSCNVNQNECPIEEGNGFEFPIERTNSYQQRDGSSEVSNGSIGDDVMIVKTEVGGNSSGMEYNNSNTITVTRQCTEVARFARPSIASTSGVQRVRKRSIAKPVATSGHGPLSAFPNNSGSFGLNLEEFGYGETSQGQSSWNKLESTTRTESQLVNPLLPANSDERTMHMEPDEYNDSFGSASDADLKNFLSGEVYSPQITDDEGQLMDGQMDGSSSGANRGTFVCEFSGCGLSFVHSYTLYRHQRTKHGRRHGAVQQQLFYCPVDQCGKVFCREGTLNNHIRDVHREQALM